MAQVGIREYDAKRWLRQYVLTESMAELVLVSPRTNLANLEKKCHWLTKKKLVVKPDQLFGRRGKHGLVLLNASLKQVVDFIKKMMGTTVTVGKTTGTLTHFLIEPFVPHKDEFYIAIKSERAGDRIYFSLEGGVEVEEHWEKVKSVIVPVLGNVKDANVEKKLIQPAFMNVRPHAKRDPSTLRLPRLGGGAQGSGLPGEVPLSGTKTGRDDTVKMITQFIQNLYRFYVDLQFTYLELNPFTLVNDQFVPLDVVARLDDTAAFAASDKWGDIEFPVPFGRSFTKEEEFINRLDEKSGSSLKLTVLNPAGRIWTMVAGGGASVVYADTICDLGYQNELANYGEYSGNPTTDETYQYASTILELMMRTKDPRGKILIIGGGIANFTDVAKTFQGIIKALKEYATKLVQHRVRIYVRRGGPNYEQGLKNIKAAGEALGLPIEVYGPEVHMTRIVRLALEKDGHR